MDEFGIRFDTRYRTAEDQVFSVSYLVHVASAEVLVDKPRYFYRLNPASATQTFARNAFDPRILDWPRAVERSIFPTLKRAGRLKFSDRARMYWACDRAMQELRRQGRERTRLYRVLKRKKAAAVPARILQAICVPGSNPWLRRLVKRALAAMRPKPQPT